MKRCLLIMVLSFVFTNISMAATPLWTFTPLTPTTVYVPGLSVIEVEYLITNQSNKPHTLSIQRFPFRIVQFGPFNCGETFVLEPNKSCILSIFIDGLGIVSSYRGGPVFCELGTQVLCYKPSEQDILTVVYSE